MRNRTNNKIEEKQREKKLQNYKKEDDEAEKENVKRRAQEKTKQKPKYFTFAHKSFGKMVSYVRNVQCV